MTYAQNHTKIGIDSNLIQSVVKRGNAPIQGVYRVIIAIEAQKAQKAIEVKGSTKSGRSGNSISDVEDIGKIATKLSSDNMKLKSQVRKYASELQSRVAKHKIELRNAHDKIDSLKRDKSYLKVELREEKAEKRKERK